MLFLQSFDLSSPKDQELLEKVQQEPGPSLSGGDWCLRKSCLITELVQTWQESECAKGSEAVEGLRLEIISQTSGGNRAGTANIIR